MFRKWFSKGVSEYGMLIVLLLLCGYFSWATITKSPAVGVSGADDSVAQVMKLSPVPKSVAIVAGATPEDVQFTEEAKKQLLAGGVNDIASIDGQPPVARKQFSQQAAENKIPGAIISTPACNQWLGHVTDNIPQLSGTRVIVAREQNWPTFLTASNLLNVANQIVVIAIIAVGMTMVIITGGIELSVGSLVALSAVLTGALIRDHGHGVNATAFDMIWCCTVAIIACGLVGAFSGSMVTLFGVPPFITTLAMMQVAVGMAYICAKGQSIYEIPDSFTWLGRGVAYFNVPVAVWLMAIVYIAAHIVMSRTRLGRYIYAVGGNAEAARLSGVRVGVVLMTVYTISGLLAGLGGVIVASQLKSSSPTYGLSYELYVIAAVVVGGTSLNGGEGNIIGTLIGALMIAVIQNGMNLTGVESYRQRVVLGLVILGAVLLDRLKKKRWRMPGWLTLPKQTELGTAQQISTQARLQKMVPANEDD